MITDTDKEFNTPTVDENGELIEIIEDYDVFKSDDTELEEKPDNFYKGVENDISELTPNISTVESIINENRDTFNTSRDRLIEIYTSILAKGEISAEDNMNIEESKEQYVSSYNAIKEAVNAKTSKTLEERLEELKEGMVGATTDDILNILTEGGTKCWLYKDDDDNVLIDGTSIPDLTVLVNKLNLIAIEGENSSSITLTPYLIQLIAESDIKLSAKKILINGLLAGAGWSVDEEGNLDINDLNIRGTLSCDSINVDNLISASIPNALSQNIDITINSGQTISEVLDDMPLNLNGYTVNIYLNASTTENIELRRHINGIVNIFISGNVINGTIRGNFNNSIYNIYGGSNTTDTIQGKIMPYDGYNIGLYYYSLIFNNCPNVNLYNLKVYGAKTNSKNTVCIGGQQKSKIYMENITFVGAKYNVRTYSMAELYCDSSSGKSSGNSWSAGTGSRITLNAANQAGGGNNTYTSGNGQIISSGAIFSDTADTSSNTNTSTSTTTTRVATFKPNYADTYRSTVYNNWKRDGVARQGDWGYGDCNGCAFYGTQFAEVKGKDITKVTISVKRSGGVGNSSSVSHTFQAHSHTSRPSGSPTLLNCNKTLNLAWDESGTVTITDADILAKLKTGVIKGFGIKSAFDKAHYSALTNWTVKIYYKE